MNFPNNPNPNYLNPNDYPMPPQCQLVVALVVATASPLDTSEEVYQRVPWIKNSKIAAERSNVSPEFIKRVVEPQTRNLVEALMRKLREHRT